MPVTAPRCYSILSLAILELYLVSSSAARHKQVISLFLTTRLISSARPKPSTMRPSTFLSVVCGASSVIALGINCRGSGF